MGGVVVHDDVDVQILGDAGADLLQEVRELLGPVAPAALADDEAGGDVGSGERWGRPVAPVVAGPPLGNAWAQRRHGPHTAGRPYPALPIDAEHHRPVRPRRIEVHDVADLVREIGIAGGLEGLRTVRLQPEGVPNVPDRGPRKAALPGHRADRPAGGVGRGRMERPPDDVRHPIIPDGPRESRPGFVRQPVGDPSRSGGAICRPSAGRPPIPPQPPCSAHPRRNAGRCGNVRAGNASPAADGLAFQEEPLRLARDQGRHRPTNSTCHPGNLHSHNLMTIAQYHKLQILDIGVLMMTLAQVSPDLASETSILNSITILMLCGRGVHCEPWRCQ